MCSPTHRKLGVAASLLVQAGLTVCLLCPCQWVQGCTGREGVSLSRDAEPASSAQHRCCVCGIRRHAHQACVPTRVAPHVPQVATDRLPDLTSNRSVRAAMVSDSRALGATPPDVYALGVQRE
jgi:hypothetical protein